MSLQSEESQEYIYLVVCRAQSDARFKEDEAMVISDDSPSLGPIGIGLKTHYADEGFDVRVPRQMYVEIAGKAAAIGEAINDFWNAAATITPIIALSSNAFVSDLEVEFAYDVTPELEEHEFFQSILPKPGGLLSRTRIINAKATGALIEAIKRHPRTDRVHRAVVYYRLALENWRPGRELFCVHYLWAGIEAITPVTRNRHSETTGISAEELTRAWGVEDDKLDAAVREKLIFQGDNDCYSKARRARVGFVHAIKAFDEIRQDAIEIRNKTAKYLRNAIFNLFELEHPHLDTLQSHPYDSPMNHFPNTMYLRGILKGRPENFAHEGHPYPWFDADIKIKSFSKPDGGDYKMTVKPTFTAVIGEDVVFYGKSYEVYGPNPYEEVETDE